MSNVLGLIDDIYEAGADPSRWLSTMTRIADGLGGIEAVMGGIGAGHMPMFLAPRTDPENVQTYIEHYHAGNPMGAAMAGQPVNVVRLDNDLTDLAAFQRSEFFNDWCRPQNHLRGIALNVASGPGRRVTIMISGKVEFDADAVATATQFAPHLTRAFRFNQLLHESRSATLSTFSALNLSERGVLFVQQDGGIVAANELAETLLREGDGLTLRHGRLACVDPIDTSRLARALLQCILHPRDIDSSPVEVRRLHGRANLQVYCMPITNDGWMMSGGAMKALILIADPEARLRRQAERLHRVYGLTPAEANVVVALAQGGDRAAIAERLGTSVPTVRSQLTSIFDKTGVRRQADLVRILMEQG